MAGRSEFRVSQGIVPFGVGAVTDFPDESLMMAGLDAWPFEMSAGPKRDAIRENTMVLDGRLARRLSANLKRPIQFFLSPTIGPDDRNLFDAASAETSGRETMPFVRFPNWHFCPRCRHLKHVPWNTRGTKDGPMKCSNMGRLVEGKGDPCGKLSKSRQPTMIPVRFVAACEHGHIMDFPWVAWAHSRVDHVCDKPGQHLYLKSTPHAGLAGVQVECATCGSPRSMAGTFRKDALRQVLEEGCPGNRPWLGPDHQEKGCNCIPQTIQRGASNAYFGKVVSSILIPPHSHALQQALEKPNFWEDLDAICEDAGALPEAWVRRTATKLNFDPEVFLSAVREKFEQRNNPVPTEEIDGADAEISERAYRFEEFNAFKQRRPTREERLDFDISEVPIAEFSPWVEKCFSRVVQVKKLRETRVLTGFSRLIPPDASDNAPAQLSVKPRHWLPGYAVRGEGIFLEFSLTSVEAWISGLPQVLERSEAITSQRRRMEQERGLDQRSISPELVLVHSFAHVFIRQMAFDCGYDSSSLRERLYVSSAPETRMCGLLIYTASGDAEGTLGGLVRQADPGRLEGTILASLRNAAICS